MKANHRKTLVTENHGMILSSNSHDPSGYHQNVGVRVSGPIQKALIKSEIAAINMSGAQYDESDFKINHNSWKDNARSEEHTSELQSRFDLVCRLLLEKKNEPA